MHRAAGLGGTSTVAKEAGEGVRWSGEVGVDTVGDTGAALRKVPAEVATEKTGGGDGAMVGAGETGDECRNVGAGAGRMALGGSGAEAGGVGGSPTGMPLEEALAAGNTEIGS